MYSLGQLRESEAREGLIGREIRKTGRHGQNKGAQVACRAPNEPQLRGPLFEAERLDRVQGRGSICRVKSKANPDCGTDDQSSECPAERKDQVDLQP